MIYIRVCNSACLTLFDLEGFGACLLNLEADLSMFRQNTEQNHNWLYMHVFKHVREKNGCLPMCLLCLQNLNPIQINRNTIMYR